jgi:hypothetical protein
MVIHDKSLHINGTVEIDSNLACNSCHGSATNDAPPQDVQGNTSTLLASIGAHQGHVAGNTISSPIACSECHQVPSHYQDAGHIDSDLPAEVSFGALATHPDIHFPNGPQNSTWDGTRCNNIYCHNPALDDDHDKGPGVSVCSDNPPTNPCRDSKPIWIQVDGTQKQCDSCHGYPPWTNFHWGPDPNCSGCHYTVIAPDDVTILDPSKHINGMIDVF